MTPLYKDRYDAAKKLANQLLWLKNENPIILAVPRGGLVVGDVISSILGCKLDIIVSRKVGAPNNPELAIGALMHDGSYFPNIELTRRLNVSDAFVKEEITKQLKEVDSRLMKFRGSIEYNLTGKTVVIIDDGIATGSTVLAACLWLKKLKLKKIIISAPVGPKEILDKLNQIADMVVVLESPQDFNSVSEFYHEFDQVSDSKVQEIMRIHGYKPNF